MQVQTEKLKDWSTQVLKDLTEFKIRSTYLEIGLIKEENWKSLVKSKSTVCALKFLNSTVASKSKKYLELKISYFLSSNCENIPVETAKFIAKTQSHMIENIKTNCRTPDLPILPSLPFDWKIWKALYSRGCLVGRSSVTVGTVLLLLWPLKMLKLSKL